MAVQKPSNFELPTLPGLSTNVSFSNVIEHGTQMREVLNDVRAQVHKPYPRKAPPTFTVGQLAELCNTDRNRINYLANLEGSDLPPGTFVGRKRVFSLADARQWIKSISGVPARPEGAPCRVILCGNFKGGSTKTTTAMCLAQGLSLRGRRVLLVDLDPQGTLTDLCGYYSDVEISEEETMIPYFRHYLGDGGPEDLRYAVKPTYWDGIEVIPASAAAASAEFDFPNIQSKNPSIHIWTLLDRGLAPLKHEYDYIVIDSPPSLSYGTVNAMMTANAVLMPLVPDNLDYVSSIQFWQLFTDIAKILSSQVSDRSLDFVAVLLSKVDASAGATANIRGWAKKTYGDWLLNLEIPKSDAAKNSAAFNGTIYDNVKGEEYTSEKTLNRIRTPFNELCRLVDTTSMAKWAELTSKE